MKIVSKQVYNRSEKKPNSITKIGFAESAPHFSSLSFGANPTTKFINKLSDNASIIFSKTAKEVTCTNANKLASNLNKLLGDDTFSKKLAQAGGKIQDDKIIVSNRNFLRDDFLKTILFPVDIFTSLAEKYSQKSGKAFAQDGIIQRLINSKHKDEARNWILDTFEEFSERQFGDELDLEKYTSKFKDIITSNGVKIKKGYATRDERTINRIVTSLVSAFFSSWDFHNISMLEKDDSTEAKQAKKDRFKQELSRLGFNASLTFIALGMFDRYTKRHIVANSIVIAASALIAEISSRLMSGTPIGALSPEEAAKIAKIRKEKKAQKEQAQATLETQKTQDNSKKVAFKANSKTQNEIFKDFTSNGSLNALDIQKKSITQNINTSKDNNGAKPKKKMKITQALGLAVGAATAIFFITKAAKGDYRAIARQKEFLETFGGEDMKKNYFAKNAKIAIQNIGITINNFLVPQNRQEKIKPFGKNLDLSKLSKEQYVKAQKLSEEITRQHKDSTKSYSFWKNLQDMLTTVEKSESTENIIAELEELKRNPKAKNIEGILDSYIEHAKKFAKENSVVKSKQEIFFVSGVVKGFSKLFKTVYDILTLPAKILNALIESITGADVNKKTFNGIYKKLNPSAKKYENELMEIHNKIQKAKNGNLLQKMTGLTEQQKTQNVDDLIETIGACARNIETSQETGDLANMSRTMVTAIGTWFFVNDYKNSVLIESEGKNIKGAEEEAKERIWHKAFNFIFNGTLMNVFNTTFAPIVNGSLIGAAAVATATEITNESLIRKSLNQPAFPQKSRQDIIDFEIEQTNKTGFWGTWSRAFKKLTGKKSLTQKAGIDIKNNNTQKA